MRLLVDRQQHCVLRRLQIQPNNVRRLLGEGGIGADAPTASPRERNLVAAQHAPDLVLGDVAQFPGQQGAIPTGVTRRRRRIQSRQHPPLVFGCVVPRLAAARRVAQTRQALVREPAPPLADRRCPRPQPLRHRSVAQPLGQRQHHFRPERHAPFGLAGRQPRPQRRAILLRQCNLCRSHTGSVPYSLIFATRY